MTMIISTEKELEITNKLFNMLLTDIQKLKFKVEMLESFISSRDEKYDGLLEDYHEYMKEYSGQELSYNGKN